MQPINDNDIIQELGEMLRENLSYALADYLGIIGKYYQQESLGTSPSFALRSDVSRTLNLIKNVLNRGPNRPLTEKYWLVRDLHQYSGLSEASIPLIHYCMSYLFGLDMDEGSVSLPYHRLVRQFLRRWNVYG